MEQQTTASALVVTPDRTHRETCSAWLREAGLSVYQARSGREALNIHQRRTVAFTLSDIELSGIDGVELLCRIHTIHADAVVVLCADRNPTDMAVTAIKAGASDFFVKPVDRTRLISAARAAAGQSQGVTDLARRRRELFARHDFEGIVCRSPEMFRVLELVSRVAPLDCTVLISGQSGTGKELVARAIHRNSGRRRAPFVSINCAAIPEGLIESELFGYRRGAFTDATSDKEGLLQAASGGTIFLDEIGEVPAGMQAKLLRFLQHREFYPIGATHPVRADVRIVAATNADLERLVDAGKFREDLYYRLRVFPIHLAPLSERPDDIVPLARYFLKRLEGQVGKPVPGLSQEAARYLRQRFWRGNVRELQNAVEYAVIMSDGNLLTSRDFQVTDPQRGGVERAHDPCTWRLPDEGIDLDSLVRSLTVQALERTDFCVSKAARLLGLSRPTLRYRMKKYGLGPSTGVVDEDAGEAA